AILSLGNDGRSLTIRLPGDPAVEWRLSAAATDTLLESLGRLRARLKPEVVSQFRRGHKGDSGVEDPRWVLEREALRGDPLLHIRDPRFGWLHYLIPAAEALRLSDGLRAQALANGRAEHPSSGKTN